MVRSADAFFAESKQAAAVLKHGVLRRYLGRFAGKVGHSSPGHKVGYLDAYAGGGEYVHPGSGATSAGSPRIALDIAKGLKPAQLECVFVEREPAQFASLQRVVSTSGHPNAHAYQGEIQTRLPECLRHFENAPLLVLLDPFGTALDTETLVGSLLNRPGTWPTEVLLNFSVDSVRRIGARIFEPEGTKGRSASLDRLDRWLGGDWWKRHFEDVKDAPRSARPTLAAEAVFEAYVRRVGQLARCGSFALPVRRQAGHKPIFMLTLFFRGRHAPYPFNEAISLATEDWRKHLHELDLAWAEGQDTKQPTLPGLSRTEELITVFDYDEREIHQVLSDQVTSAMIEALQTRTSLSVQTDLALIFGDALGTARQMHLRSAWKRLAKDGLTNPPPKGELERAIVARGTAWPQ